MEGSSSFSAAQPSGPCPTTTKLLANLPSRGLFSSSTVLSSNPGGMRVYVCEHETSPPDGQHIKTNQQNILIRALKLRKQKVESSPKNGKSVTLGEGTRKRTSERLQENGASAKKPAGARQDVSTAGLGDMDLHSLTVERLRALLKERNLSPRGKKDELVARLRNSTS